MCKYSFQSKIAKNLFLQSEHSDVPTVLASAPGSGKTAILIHFLNKYFEKYPSSKVVIIPSNSLELLDQFYKSLKDGVVNVNFSFSKISERQDSQVVLSLPKTLINRINDGFVYNALVLDEAHLMLPKAYADGPNGHSMMTRILSTYKLQMAVFMTGSPYFFNAYPSSFNIIHYSAEEIEGMANEDVFNGMDVHLFRSKDNSILTKLRETYRYIKHSRIEIGKALFFCSNQQEAVEVKYFLNNYFRLISGVSTSSTDPDCTNVKKFKEGDLEILIVVGRLREGFSDHGITTIIDFGCTLNESLCQQQLCRLNRWHPKVDRKNYIRVLSNDDKNSVNDHVKFFYKVKSLFTRDGFREFKVKAS